MHAYTHTQPAHLWSDSKYRLTEGEGSARGRGLQRCTRGQEGRWLQLREQRALPDLHTGVCVCDCVCVCVCACVCVCVAMCACACAVTPCVEDGGGGSVIREKSGALQDLQAGEGVA